MRVIVTVCEIETLCSKCQILLCSIAGRRHVAQVDYENLSAAPQAHGRQDEEVCNTVQYAVIGVVK